MRARGRAGRGSPFLRRGIASASGSQPREEMSTVLTLAVIVVLVILLVRVWPSGHSGSRFTPIPIDTCAQLQSDRYVIDMTDRTGTVVRNPYPPPPGLSKEGYAGRKGTLSVANPTAAPPGAGLSGDPTPPAGLVQAADDRLPSLMASIARRSPPTLAGPHGSRANLGDIDTDFVSDGLYEPEVMKEALTSRRRAEANPLTASKVGLGSVRMDPRFEPGPPGMLDGGDTNYAPGSHAGGPSLGAYDSSRFQNKGGWGSNYVFGFGDVGTNGPEALVTGDSQW